MQKINKNIAKWVMDIYLNNPHSETCIRLCDFKKRYNCSYPTMYKFLPHFFKIENRSYFFWWSSRRLTKFPDLELIFNSVKSLNDSRFLLKFLSLFLSKTTSAEFYQDVVKSLELNNKSNEK